MILPYLSKVKAVRQFGLMSCLSAVSLRLFLPNWIESIWRPEDEQETDQGLEPTILNAASPYKRTEHAVYGLEHDKSASSPERSLPVCLQKQIETRRALRIGPSGNRPSEFSRDAQGPWYCLLTLHPSENRFPNTSMQSDCNSDREIIELPHIPPNIRLVKGRIIDVVTGNSGFPKVQSHIW